MDKDELKERIRVPLLGFSAVLMSIVAFLLLLYGITVVVRFLFALGSLGLAMAYTSRQNNVFKCGGRRSALVAVWRIFGKAGQ